MVNIKCVTLLLLLVVCLAGRVPEASACYQECIAKYCSEKWKWACGVPCAYCGSHSAYGDPSPPFYVPASTLTESKLVNMNMKPNPAQPPRKMQQGPHIKN